MTKRAAYQHSTQFKKRAINLFFKIEKHILTGGNPLLVSEVREMMGLRSNSTAVRYIRLLVKWGLVIHPPFTSRTITLAKSN